MFAFRRECLVDSATVVKRAKQINLFNLYFEVLAINIWAIGQKTHAKVLFCVCYYTCMCVGVLRRRLFLLQATTCVTRFAQPFVNREVIHRRAACMFLLLEHAPYAQIFHAVYSNTHMLANQEYHSPQIPDRVLFSSALGSPQVPL